MTVTRCGNKRSLNLCTERVQMSLEKLTQDDHCRYVTVKLLDFKRFQEIL